MKAFNLFDGELDKRRDQAGFSWDREPGGERELRPGDTVAFPEGPDGAHQVLNRSDEPVRVLILSTKGRFPGVAVYPDSDKLGVWLADGYSGIFRRGDAVDYWEGEG